MRSLCGLVFVVSHSVSHSCLCVSHSLFVFVRVSHSLTAVTGYELTGSQLKSSQSADLDEQMRFTMGRPLSELVNTVLPK